MTSYATNSDIDVDPAGIQTEGERLKTLAPDFSIVADYASEADPDWHMWGVPGLTLAQLYFASSDQIKTILQEFDPATDGLGRRFIDCAEAYTDADDQSADEFNEFEGEITWPSSRPRRIRRRPSTSRWSRVPPRACDHRRLGAGS